MASKIINMAPQHLTPEHGYQIRSSCEAIVTHAKSANVWLYDPLSREWSSPTEFEKAFGPLKWKREAILKHTI